MVKEQNTKKKLMIDPSDDDFGAVCICAIRYALGRRTYMPDIVRRFIQPLIPCLSYNDLSVIESELLDCKNYGDERLDKPGWLLFLKNIQKELKERNG